MTSSPPPAPSPSRSYTDEQRSIIEASCDARQMVIAAPGTGKSAVLAERIAHLIEQGVMPSSILVASFTRAAVAELKSRLVARFGDSAHALRVATLDSHTWTLRVGYQSDHQARKVGSYGQSIEGLLDLLGREDDGLCAFLGDLSHVLVDEAQDIVGQRASLMVALIGRLAPSCGVTIFGDDAQAIYGFSHDGGSEAPPTSTLLDLLLEHQRPFASRSLTRCFRASTAETRKVFEQARATVRGPERGAARFAAVREVVSRYAHRTTDESASLRGRDDVMVLFRRRADAMLRASNLASAGVEHRLRLSGLPQVVHPWIGHVLYDHGGHLLTGQVFRQLWASKSRSPILRARDADACWAQLCQVAGTRQGIVDMKALREAIARPRPPLDLCLPDVGERGPIVSTIHAAKGRETAEVWMGLSPASDWAEDACPHAIEEEARVLYVAATRAKERLCTFTHGRPRAGSLETSDRAVAIVRDPAKLGAQLQVGLAGDVDAAASATGPTARHMQERLSFLASRPLARLCASYEGNNRHGLYFDDHKVGELGPALSRDIWAMARQISTHRRISSPRPSRRINHIYLVGLTTASAPGDGPAVDAPSGLFLAPVVMGFPTIFFSRKP